MATKSASGLGTEKSEHQPAKLDMWEKHLGTHLRHELFTGSVTHSSLLFTFSQMREKQGNKTTETQDDINSPTHRYTPPPPLLAATQQGTENLIGQTCPQETCHISFRNRIVPSKGEGSYISGITQDFIAAGTTHV